MRRTSFRFVAGRQLPREGPVVCSFRLRIPIGPMRALVICCHPVVDSFAAAAHGHAITGVGPARNELVHNDDQLVAANSSPPARHRRRLEAPSGKPPVRLSRLPNVSAGMPQRRAACDPLQPAN
jgi:hypothetical protein